MPKIIEWNKHQGVVFDSKNNFKIIDCQKCGFKHTVPIPLPEELDKVYREEYYSKEKPLLLEQQKEDLDWWNIAFSERYDTFESLLLENQRRILDIGSGPGFFLNHGSQRGWKTLGIEPSTQAVEHSRNLGLEIVEDFLNDETATQLGIFDVVHMSDVLEHLSDPISMIRHASKLLHPGGIVCIVVPNDYNPFQLALRKSCDFEPWWLAPPHHINYFDFDSLTKLVVREGFEIVLTEATFPIDIFLLMGENYLENKELGRVCHNKRKTFEHNLKKSGLSKMKRELYQALASQGLGREIILFGKKL